MRVARYEFDCRACTNKAYSQVYGHYYCLPDISTGKSPMEFHDMGGSKKGDYMTCAGFTTEPRPLAIYEAVSVFSAEHPCNEPEMMGGFE